MERLAHVDALRGGAALLLLMHALPLATADGATAGLGVDLWLLATLWFLLGCGFVVPASLHASSDGGRGFVVRRLLRLVPLYLLAALLTALLLPEASAWLPGVTAAKRAIPFEVASAYGAMPPILLFYLLCLLMHQLGLLHSVSLRAGAALLLLACSLLLALARQLLDGALPVTLPLLVSLMLFASLRHEAQHADSSYARRRAREYARYTRRAYVLVLPVIFLAGWSQGDAAWARQLLTYAVALAGFVLLTGRLTIGTPLLVWLGQLGYGLYLLLPAMQRLAALLMQNLAISGPGAVMGTALLGLLLALGSAMLCRWLLEQPLAHAGKRLTGQSGLLPLARLHTR